MKTAARKPRTSTAVSPGTPRTRITDKEKKTTDKMLRRKKGALRAEIAEKLGISEGRVQVILRHLNAQSRHAGLKGRLGRTLCYYLD